MRRWLVGEVTGQAAATWCVVEAGPEIELVLRVGDCGALVRQEVLVLSWEEPHQAGDPSAGRPAVPYPDPVNPGTVPSAHHTAGACVVASCLSSDSLGAEVLVECTYRVASGWGPLDVVQACVEASSYRLALRPDFSSL